MGSKTFRKLQWLIVLPVVDGIGLTHYNNKVLALSQWLGFHSSGSISFSKVSGRETVYQWSLLFPSAPSFKAKSDPMLHSLRCCTCQLPSTQACQGSKLQ